MFNLVSQVSSGVKGNLMKNKRYCSSCGYDKDEVTGHIVVSPKRPFTKRFVCKECMIKRGVRISEKSRYFS